MVLLEQTEYMHTQHVKYVDNRQTCKHHHHVCTMNTKLGLYSSVIRLITTLASSAVKG